MFSVVVRVLSIKDLKDLSVFLVGDTRDMQDLKDLKRCFSRMCSPGKPSRLRGWQARASALRLKKSVPFTVGRGPVPRHASVGEMALAGGRFSRGSNARGGQAPALR